MYKNIDEWVARRVFEWPDKKNTFLMKKFKPPFDNWKWWVSFGLVFLVNPDTGEIINEQDYHHICSVNRLESAGVSFECLIENINS